MEIFRSGFFLGGGIHFLIQAPMSQKLILNTFLCFSPIDLALSVSSSDPVRVSLKVESILWLRYLQMMVIII